MNKKQKIIISASIVTILIILDIIVFKEIPIINILIPIVTTIISGSMLAMILNDKNILNKNKI